MLSISRFRKTAAGTALRQAQGPNVPLWALPLVNPAFLGLDVAVAGGGFHGVDEDRGVGRGGRSLEAGAGTPDEDLTILAGPDALVIKLDNQELRELVPTLHHHVGVSDGLAGQIFSAV